MGARHLQTLVWEPGVRVRFLVSGSGKPQLHHRFPDALRDCRFLTADQDQQVFQDEKVDGVIIASPTSAHESQVRRALEAGKAVFCEKPVVASAHATKECYRIAQENAATLFCAFQRRFDPSFMELHRKVHSGAIGNIHMIKSCSRDSKLPSKSYLNNSGSIFFDSTVHDLDMCCWMAGEEPSSLYAAAEAKDPDLSQDWDTVALTLRFPSGTLAVIDQSRSAAYGYDQRLEVFGDKGMVQISNSRENSVEIWDENGSHQASVQNHFLKRYEEAYKLEIRHFISVLKNEETCLVSPRAAIRSLELAEAAELSVKEDRVIHLQF